MGIHSSLPVGTFLGLGWNCYINSILQCLLACPDVLEFINAIKNNSDNFHEQYKVLSYLSDFADTFQSWDTKRSEPIKNKNFIREFFKSPVTDDGSLTNECPGDTIAFLLGLLRCCDNELQASRNTSFSSLFRTDIVSTSVCPIDDDHKVTRQEEYFATLNPNRDNIQESFNDLKNEHEGICIVHDNPTKVYPYFSDLPHVFIAKLSIFGKCPDFLITPIHIEEGCDHLTNVEYDLQSISVSYTGHAIAIIKKDDKWYYADDEKSNEIEFDNILRGNKVLGRKIIGVILFYTRKTKK